MSAANPWLIRSVGRSDVGRRRQVNEDAFLCDDELGLWVVADGMGGHAAGEIASREAIDTIHGMVRRGKRHLEGDVASDAALRAAIRVLEGSVQAATYFVFAMSELDASKSGMGTTISAMMSVGSYVVTAQVGDSRIYKVRDDYALQLTEDHTLVNWQLKQGIITEEEAMYSRHKNVITRAVGNRDYVQVDTGFLELESGDTYLLCSDGLHGYFRNDEIASIIRDSEDAADRFIEVANQRGGKDNITAIVVTVDSAS